jgi:hypothetical protein
MSNRAAHCLNLSPLEFETTWTPSSALTPHPTSHIDTVIAVGCLNNDRNVIMMTKPIVPYTEADSMHEQQCCMATVSGLDLYHSSWTQSLPRPMTFVPRPGILDLQTVTSDENVRGSVFLTPTEYGLVGDFLHSRVPYR